MFELSDKQNVVHWEHFKLKHKYTKYYFFAKPMFYSTFAGFKKFYEDLIYILKIKAEASSYMSFLSALLNAMLRFIAMSTVHLRTWSIYNAGITLYIVPRFTCNVRDFIGICEY